MSELHIAIPVRGRDDLTKIAVRSITRSRLACHYRIHVIPGEFGTWGADDNARKLDWCLARLPQDAQWFFAMHNDAAVFEDWYTVLRHAMRQERAVAAGFRETSEGCPHPCGTLYSVPWLRMTGASFKPEPGLDCGEAMWERHQPKHAWAIVHDPWRQWYDHLGGGTAGANAWRRPTWWWKFSTRLRLL